jgi:hypothetical protein
LVLKTTCETPENCFIATQALLMPVFNTGVLNLPGQDMAGVLIGCAVDYSLKDHFGNVRAIVTDTLQQDLYPVVTG